LGAVRVVVAGSSTGCDQGIDTSVAGEGKKGMEDRFKEIALVVRYQPKGKPQIREVEVTQAEDGAINAIFGLFIPEDADFSIVTYVTQGAKLQTKDGGAELWTRDTCPDCNGGMLAEEPSELKCAKCGKVAKANTCDGCGYTTVAKLGVRPDGKTYCEACGVFLRRGE